MQSPWYVPDKFVYYIEKKKIHFREICPDCGQNQGHSDIKSQMLQ